MGDFSVQEFNAEDFQFEHEDRLNERNGQWLDENMNTSLWLSQGCYVSGKCIVEGEDTCNVRVRVLSHLLTNVKGGVGGSEAVPAASTPGVHSFSKSRRSL